MSNKKIAPQNTIENPLKIVATAVSTNDINYNKQILHGDKFILVDHSIAVELRTENERLKQDYNNEVLNSESLQRYWIYEKETVKTLQVQLEEQKHLTASLAEALTGMRDYFQFMIKDPKFHEFVRTQDVLAKYNESIKP